MWNRWTFSAAFALGAAALTAHAEAPTVRYAWMAIEDGRSEFHATLPVGDDWDACVLVAPLAPFTLGENALLELTSGEILPGSIEKVDTDEVLWRSPRLGERRIAISDIAAVRQDGAPIDSAGALLRNGDEVRGDVHISTTGIEHDGGRIPWERVAGVRLRKTEHPPPSNRLWLRNGGVLSVQSVEPRPGGILVRTESGAGLYRLDEVLALTTGELRVRAIGRPDESAAGVSVDDAALTARAPATAEWRLSGSAQAIVGAARTPEDSRAWGDALYSLWVGSELIVSARVSPDRPLGAIAASVAPDGDATLTLSVHPGSAGKANGVLELSLAVVEAP